jgi:uncharacterized protein (DUF885 family)
MRTQQGCAPPKRHGTRAVLSLVLALLLALAIPLQACTSQEPLNEQTSAPVVATPQDTAFDAFAEELFVYEITGSYSLFNQFIENPSTIAAQAPAPSFGDYSLETFEADLLYYEDFLSRLSGYEIKDLDPTRQITYQQIKKSLETTLAYKDLYYYAEPLSAAIGEQAELPINLMNFNFRTRADIDGYLTLLADLPRHFEQLAQYESKKQELGLLMPSEAMEDVLSETLQFSGNASEHILTTFFNEKLQGEEEPFASLTPAEKRDYQKRNLKTVGTSVVPAYTQLYDALEALKPSCKPGTALADYPQGQAYYQLEMQALGFAQTPAEAAQTLDEQLAKHWDTLLDSSVSLDQAMRDVEEALNAVPDEPEGMLAFFRQHYTREFPGLSTIEYTIKKVPEETPSDLALAFFVIPPVDNPQQNMIFYYPQNLSEKPDLYTTLAHESIPGHMYQTAYFAEQNPANIQKYLLSSAYMEGWAEYTQNLSYSFLNIPAASGEANVAFVKFMYGLNARVDIGVNYEGWDIATLEKYLEQWLFEDAAEDFYLTAIKQPVVYLPYGLGVVEFDQLRQRAEAELGDSFNPVTFHHQLLKNGAVDFTILESNFEIWLKTQQ